MVGVGDDFKRINETQNQDRIFSVVTKPDEDIDIHINRSIKNNGGVDESDQKKEKSQPNNSNVANDLIIADNIHIDSSNDKDGGADENDQKKEKSQPNNSNGANDLIIADNSVTNVSNVDNKSSSNISNDNQHSNKTRTVIDMKIIAHEMWKLLNCKLNPKLTEAFAKLPIPVHNAVTKTVIYRFEPRPANLPNDQENYSLKALIYIELLKRYKQTLTDQPLTLIGMKCAYCAERPTHIPGSSSFMKTKDLFEKPEILADALHQRLLHLRNSCAIARQKHGPEVVSLFDSSYNKNDIHLKRFTTLWLKELEQHFFPSLPSSFASPSSLTPSSSREMNVPQLRAPVASNPRPAATFGPSGGAARMVEAIQPPRPIAPVVIAAAHNIAVMKIASHQRQQQNQHHRQLQLAMLQQQQQHHQQYQRSPLQHRPGNPNYPPRYSNQYLTQTQHLLLQQQLIRNQQQTQTTRQQKPRQRHPQIFPRNKHVPFVELQKIYEDGWEDLTWFMFNPPYDSDDDDDDYFGSTDNISKCDVAQTKIKSKSFKESLPQLPSPKVNLDFCIPFQSYQLALCPEGVPFLKEEEGTPTSKKVRGRSRQSSASINIELSDSKSHDVIMPSEGCPLDLAESLHNLTGNCRFMRLVSEDRNNYAVSSSETERLNIINKVVQRIIRRGGSFLKANVMKRKGTSRTFKTTDKERFEYTRYRLEKGFHDILNPKIGKYKWVCPALKSSNESNPPADTTTTETVKVLPPSIKTLNGNTEGDIVSTPTVTSKVLEVEHAPKVGLIGGYLEWNNNGFTSNPKIKFSDLRKRIENTRGSIATATVTTSAHGSSNGVITDVKKEDNNSVNEGTIISTDTITRKDVKRLTELDKAPSPAQPEDNVSDFDRKTKVVGEKKCGEKKCKMPNGKKTTNVTTDKKQNQKDVLNNKRNSCGKTSCEETEPQSTKRLRLGEVNNSPLLNDRSDVKKLFDNGFKTNNKLTTQQS